LQNHYVYKQLQINNTKYYLKATAIILKRVYVSKLRSKQLYSQRKLSIEKIISIYCLEHLPKLYKYGFSMNM
jgi:hypothetical protein